MVSAEDRRLLDEQATFVREMEQELQADDEQQVGHPVPELEPGVKIENDNMPAISKMQIDLLVNSFVERLRARRDAPVHERRRAGARCGGWESKKGTTALSHEPDCERGGPSEADEDQQVVLRATGLPRQTPGRDARAGRRRAACWTTR